MINTHTLRLAGSALAVVAAILAAPLAAQDDAGDWFSGDGRPSSTIVVTGTLIRSSAEDAPAPVEVISGEELAQQGSPSIMDLARRLPVSAGVIGDASQFDSRSQFNQGSASVNLRGLGPQRTLVLLNGKRMVATGAGNLPLVDVNLFPMASLGRIEILKDGAAATYGSDAIAGVVNFITRTDQDGFFIGGDYRYIDGSKGDWTGSASYGRDYGAARVFVSAGYQRRSELRITDRDYIWMPFDRNPQGGFSGGGNPGNFDFDGTANGLNFTADEGCEGLGGFRSLPGSSADLCSSSYLGFTNLVEPEERYQLFGDVELDVGDTSSVRLTALYGRTTTVLNTSPSFLPTIAPSANAAFGGTGLFTIPSYAPALADYCARFGAAAGCAVDGAGVPQENALAFPVRFRPLLTGGNPLFDNDRGVAALKRDSDAYQFTGEFRTEVSPSLELTAGLTWSQYDRFFEIGDSFVDLLQNSLAGFGGPNCAFASPASRAGMNAAQLAAVAGTGGCQYFNPFSTGVAGNTITGVANPNYAGNGSPLALDLTPGGGLVNSAANIGDFYNVWGRTANTQEMVAELVLAGGSGFQLPGGEVSVALGAQHRQSRYARTYEGGGNLDLFPCPGSVLNPAATCNPEPGALGFIGSNSNVSVGSNVWALFGELQLPVTHGILAQLSARYEDYGALGSTFDPQARVRVEVTDWLTLRGGAGSTFRAPPPQNTSADLVSLNFIGGAFRAVDVLGNPALRPETAWTYNAGAIVGHGGFRASVDYWRYDFKGAIESEPVNGIVAAMFGASGSANCGDPAYAALQSRFTFSGGVCGSSNVQRLTTYNFNSANVSTSGLDFSASYDLGLGGDARVQIGAQGSYVLEYEVGDVSVEGIVVQRAFDAVGQLNYQTTAYPLPRWKGQAWVQGVFGDHSLRLQLNHIDSYEDQRGASVFGPNGGALAGAVVSEGKVISAFTTLDATWRWSLPSGTTLAVNLANILDADAPFARLDQNFDPFTADALGFSAKFSISQSF